MHNPGMYHVLLLHSLGSTTLVSTLGAHPRLQVSNMGAVQPSKKQRIIIDSDSEED